MTEEPASTRPGHPALRHLLAEPGRFHPFAALRILEASLPPALPGESPSITFLQLPNFHFADSALVNVLAQGDRQWQVIWRGFGLFAPFGPLPIHLTELARQRFLHAHDEGMTVFLSMLTQRVAHYYYRAWADGRPEQTVSNGHGDFSHRLDQLLGGPNRLLPAWRGQPAASLEYLIEARLGLLATIQPFQAHWRPLPPQHRFAMGQRLGGARLIGRRRWTTEGAWRLRVHAPAHAAWMRLSSPRQPLRTEITKLVGGLARLRVDRGPMPRDTPQQRLGAPLGSFRLGVAPHRVASARAVAFR